MKSLRQRTGTGNARRSSQLVVSFALVASWVLALGLAFAPTVRAESWPMTPDQERYATAWGADPYQDKDLHVAVVGGRPQAVSFLHFDLTSVPTGATVSSLVATLTPNANPHQNVGDGSVGRKVLACIETAPFPAQFDPTSSSSFYDCSQLQAVATPQPDGAWKVDLAAFVAEWRAHGNTGLALVGTPAPTGTPADAGSGGGQSNWIVSFDHTKTRADVTYTLAAAAAAPLARPAGTVEEAPAAVAETSVPAVVSEGSPRVAARPSSASQPTPPSGSDSATAAPEPVVGTPASVAGTSTPLGAYGAIMVWTACAMLLAVGTVMRLRGANGFSLHALRDVVRDSVHHKSTWLAGVPLTVVVVGGMGAAAYLTNLNRQVVPPLAFEAAAPSDAPRADGAPADESVPTAPGERPGASGDEPMPQQVGEGADTPRAEPGSAVNAARSAAPESSAAYSPAVGELDGRWVVAKSSVAGYRMGYSSPTGRGTRVGRTESGEGASGEIRLSGSSVPEGKFSVDMRKVYCDGGSTCTDHVNEIMDVEHHPYQTLELASAIELGAVPNEGEQVTSHVSARLTLRGVTRTVTFDVTSRRSAGRIEVLGSIPVNRDDYNIPDSNEPGFSIDKEGAVEFLMVFERAAG